MIPRFSVRFYLAISHSLFVFLILGGTSLFWYRQQENVAEIALRNQLKERARLLATTSNVDQALSFDFNLPAIYTAINTNLRVVYLSSDLQTKTLSDQAITAQEQAVAIDLGKKALAGATVSRELYNNGHANEVLYAAAPVFNPKGEVIGAVCLLLPLGEFETTLARTRLAMLGFSAGIALLSLLLSILLAALLTRPLTKAQGLAARVAAGDYSLRLPQKGPRELAELAGNLNQMAEELQKQTRERRLVLSNITHELARPLGGLRLGVESLRDGAMQDSALAADMVNEMLRSIQGMEALIDDLSIAAQPVTRPVKIDLKPVAVEPLIHGLRARFWPRANMQGVLIEVNLPTDLPPILADELRFYQIMANLLDNAIKFSPPGSKVSINGKTISGSLQLNIEDNGPGIPDDVLERVFEPFYQVSTAKIKQGMGLGLSIAHQLAIAQNGRLEVKNRPEGGLVVTITIPLAGNCSTAGSDETECA